MCGQPACLIIADIVEVDVAVVSFAPMHCETTKAIVVLGWAPQQLVIVEKWVVGHHPASCLPQLGHGGTGNLTLSCALEAALQTRMV